MGAINGAIPPSDGGAVHRVAEVTSQLDVRIDSARESPARQATPVLAGRVESATGRNQRRPWPSPVATTRRRPAVQPGFRVDRRSGAYVLVRSAIPRRRPICSLVRPSATRCITSPSRTVSLGRASGGASGTCSWHRSHAPATPTRVPVVEPPTLPVVKLRLEPRRAAELSDAAAERRLTDRLPPCVHQVVPSAGPVATSATPALAASGRRPRGEGEPSVSQLAAAACHQPPACGSR